MRYAGNFELEFDAKNDEHAALVAEMITSGYDIGHFNMKGFVTQGTLLPVDETPVVQHLTRRTRRL